jgi:hypothetical protein
MVGFAPRESAHVLDQLAVGPSIGRADSNVDADVRPFAPQVVWPNRTGMDLHCEHMTSTPEDDLQLRDQSGNDVVADPV